MVKEEATIVHFKITGEFMTEQARNFWIEDEKDKAIKFLMDSLPGLTEEQAISVCIGKVKFSGDSEKGVNLENDDTKEQKGIKLLTIQESFEEKKKEIKKLKEEKQELYDKATLNLVGTASPWGFIMVTPLVARKLRERKIGWDDPEFYEYEHEAVINKRKAKFLEDTLKEQREKKKQVDTQPLSFLEVKEEKIVPPDPDPTLSSLNGWIDREGRFYICQYGGHIELAYKFGKEGKELEDLGWVKVQDHTIYNGDGLKTNDIWIGKIKPTHEQKKTIFKWSEKHKRELDNITKKEMEEV